jgi:excisionase family DNA binding protein
VSGSTSAAVASPAFASLPARRLPGPLAAWSLGERGPLVVTVHGLAESSRYWTLPLSRLADDHRMVTVDLLGFGRSPWPDLGYSAEGHADALRATLDAAGLAGERAVVVGHQAGAAVALAYAGRYPDAVASVVALGTPWFRSPGEARRALRGPWWLSRWLVEHEDRARLLCLTLCGGRRPLVPRLARWFAPATMPAEVVEDAFLHTWRSLSGTLASCWIEASLPAMLGDRFAVPVLALHGDEDALVPVENLVDAAVTRPWLHVETLAGRGHNLAWDDPAAVAAIVDEAAQRLRRGSAGHGSLAVPAPAPRRRLAVPGLVAAEGDEITVAEAARLARVERRTVIGWVAHGAVTARRSGNRLRVDRASLLRHVFGSDQPNATLLGSAWLSAAEAAARLGVGHATLARFAAAGLPSHRVAGRRVFLAAELDAWAQQRAAQGRRR